MLLAFLDDSVNQRSGLATVAGFVLGDEALLALQSEVDGIFDRLGVPKGSARDPFEVKFSLPKDSPFRGFPAYKELCKYLLQALAKHDFRAVGSVLTYGPGKGPSLPDAVNADLVYNLERIQAFATSVDQRALVIFDSGTDHQSTVKRIGFAAEFQALGTNLGGFSQLYRPVLWGDSRQHIGLQLADLIAGALCYLAGHCEGEPEHVAVEYWHSLRGRFRLMPFSGSPSSYGLKIEPRDLRERFIRRWDPYGWGLQRARQG